MSDRKKMRRRSIRDAVDGETMERYVEHVERLVRAAERTRNDVGGPMPEDLAEAVGRAVVDALAEE